MNALLLLLLPFFSFGKLKGGDVLIALSAGIFLTAGIIFYCNVAQAVGFCAFGPSVSAIPEEPVYRHMGEMSKGIKGMITLMMTFYLPHIISEAISKKIAI